MHRYGIKFVFVSSIMEGIIQADHALTKRLAICADPLTPWQNLRFIFRILELSFHGVPWLLFTFGAILRSDDMYHADNSVNLLAGEYSLSQPYHVFFS